jgi:hypothetical protein
VQGRIGRRDLNVENHDFTIAERTNGVDEILGLSGGIFSRVTKVIGASVVMLCTASDIKH